MEAEQADIVVIGMGPGGEYLAGRLAEAGLSVVGVEDRLVGGECPYWGCVPSKMMIRASNLLAEGRRIPGMAGSAGRPADQEGSHRPLGRHGGREPVRGQGRQARARQRPDHRPGRGHRDRAGRRGAARVPGQPGHRDQRRYRAGHPADRRAGGHPLLDQPGGDRDRAGPAVADRARRRRHRSGAQPGLRPFRGDRHGDRGDAPAAAAGRAGVQRADREDLHRRRNRDPHRR